MTVVHRITGYDKRTERLSLEFDVPEARMSEVRGLANVSSDDVESAGSYPLTDEAARQVALQLNLPIPVDRCDWFFEPMDVE